MAIVQIPLLGRARKSAGEMTFTKWKDKNVLKNKASNVANPDTVNQQMRRGMFAQLVVVARSYLPVLDIGFIAYRGVMSQFNAFIKYNYGTFVAAGTAPAFSVVPADMIISKGPLTPTTITSITAVNASANVTVAFPTGTTAPDQAANDKAYVVVYNETTHDRGYQLTPTLRSSGAISATLSGNATTANNVRAYLFFTRNDGSIASDTETDIVTV